MSRASNHDSAKLQQITDSVRAQAVTDLLCLEAMTDHAKEARESSAKERVPALAKMARKALLTAAARCDDKALAAELRRIALCIRWAVEDLARNVRRERYGIS